jgi:hypothetical protein
MSVPTLLVLAALLASLLALATSAARPWALLGLAASGLDVALRFRVVHLDIPHVQLVLILPALLALAGGVVWARASTKTVITAGTVMTLAGATPILLVLLAAVR